MFDHSFPACASFLSFLFEVEISSRTLIHSLRQDQSTVVQRAAMTVAECSLTLFGDREFNVGAIYTTARARTSLGSARAGRGLVQLHLLSGLDLNQKFHKIQKHAKG